MKNIAQFQINIFMILFLLSLVGCNSNDDLEDDLEDDLVEETSHTFIYNGKNYTLVKEANSWQDAISYAVANGGYLAEINSEEEQTAIFLELINNADITYDDTNNQFGFSAIWLGGNDIETEGVWIWNGNNDETEEQFWEGGIDGTAVNGLYNNWGKEPDNNGDQDVLCMGLETTPINFAGKWTDLDGSDNNLFFLIEYD